MAVFFAAFFVVVFFIELFFAPLAKRRAVLYRGTQTYVNVGGYTVWHRV